MSALKPVLRDFLVREQAHMKERKFLINILTITSNRPVMFLHPALIEMASKGKLEELSIENSLVKPILPDIKTDSEELAKLDPISKFICENNIPIVREDKDPFKLMLEYQNFAMFPKEQQVKADEFSMKVREQTNEQFFHAVMLDQFGDKEIFEIVNVIDDKDTNKSYVAEFKATGRLLAEERKFELCILSNKVQQRLMTEIDTLDLTKSDMVNVVEPVSTTVGRMVVNRIMLVEPFSDVFPFVNSPINIKNGDIIKDVNKAVADHVVTIEQYKHFLDGMYYLGNFTELSTPCVNERAITTDPNLAKRKQELYKKYADQLDDPLVIAKIEDELIAMDKSYMKGDNAMRFYTPLGGASFDMWRKKLYIAVGGIEAFDKDTSKYEFLKNSLEEGQCLEDLPKYGNESRKGSYQRGHETRNGGALTKYIIRAFHDSRIQEEDCGTNQGLKIDFSKIDIKRFKGRYIMLNGKWTEITSENINKIPLKTYTMRSPMYCKCNKNGYCFKCAGRTFSELDIKQLTMFVVDISTTFMNSAMKNMHGTKLALHEIKSLDDFVL